MNADDCGDYNRSFALRAVELKSGNTVFPIMSMRICLDVQGQLTPQSVVRTGGILNSSEILCMSLLPASINKIG